ncbi:hypothetical protein SAMN02990966_04633 [Rhodospirillales bacterium URHD0017]|nr:hypothetical protein SAMN02990966_04633 [Rhodospirillales bacterium URHD0017]
MRSDTEIRDEVPDTSIPASVQGVKPIGALLVVDCSLCLTEKSIQDPSNTEGLRIIRIERNGLFDQRSACVHVPAGHAKTGGGYSHHFRVPRIQAECLLRQLRHVRNAGVIPVSEPLSNEYPAAQRQVRNRPRVAWVYLNCLPKEMEGLFNIIPAPCPH